MTTKTEGTKKPKNPKREQLINLSNMAKKLREDMADAAETAEEAEFWATRTINYMLLNHTYNTDGATEFNTFNQWKERGATIKKGSSAFLIWGQPVGRQKADKAAAKGEEQTDDSEYDYFPLCYLFSDKQVITADELEAERAKKREEQKAEEEKARKLASLEAVELD